MERERDVADIKCLGREKKISASVGDNMCHCLAAAKPLPQSRTLEAGAMHCSKSLLGSN